MGNAIDITNEKYGMLKVIERQGKTNDGQALWKCKCDCGNYYVARGYALRIGKVKSCGCVRYKWIGEKKATHKMTNSKIYRTYSSMKNRCYNANEPSYARYGGRGITICPEWLGKNGFVNFMQWSYANGFDENATKTQCSLDRIDNNKGYSPNNCRWANSEIQANNRRSNRLIEFNGEIHTVAEWARILDISADNISRRIDYLGWDINKALTQKVNKNRKIKKGMYDEWQKVYKRLHARKQNGKLTESQFRTLLDEEAKKYEERQLERIAKE